MPLLSRKKVPFKTQLSDDDCGASCLAMILAYYGYNISVSQVNKTLEQLGAPSKLATLATGAAHYHLDVQIKSASIAALKNEHVPCIIHWNFNHFVVLEQIKGNVFFIVDPAAGQRKVSYEEFNTSYTGATLSITPNSAFKPQSHAEHNEFASFLKQQVVNRSNLLLFVSLLALSVLLQIAALVFPALTLYFVDTVIPFQLDNITDYVLIGILLFALNVGLLNYLRGVIIVKFQAVMDRSLVSGFLSRLLNLPLSFYNNKSSGDIQSRLNSHTVIRSFFSTYTLTSIIDFFTVFTYTAFVMYISIEVGLLTLAIAATLLISQFFYNNSLREKSHAELKTQASYQSYLIEILTGINLIKGTASESSVIKNWDERLVSYINAIQNRGLLDAKAVSVTRTIEIMSPALIFSFSIAQYFAGNLTLGSVIAVNSICMMALAPISSLLNHVRIFQMVKAHLSRISELWLYPEESFGNTPLPDDLSQLTLEFSDVGFLDKRSGKLILKELNFTLRFGQRVALVGPSGAGKSTLLSLIMGLHRPSHGQILLNGRDLYDYDLKQYRQKIGYVPQHSFVFNTSIRDNIVFGRNDICLDKVVSICQQLGFASDIEALPMQYETYVGQNGKRLSGGQIQRLTIARALASDPEIVVLDEATSSLDSVNETHVTGVILAFGKTQFVVSHRISTIRDSDEIIVINNGQVEASGTHETLQKTNLFYLECCRKQLQDVLA